jgi:hypothetical protein
VKKPKKYKTIHGALNSIVDQVQRGHRDKREETNEEIIARLDGYDRFAINHVLPQVGITTTIAEGEKPRDGLQRIKAGLSDPRQLKTVEDCLRFTKRPRVLRVSAAMQAAE